MCIEYKGQDGHYRIYNDTCILQLKINEENKITGEHVLHFKLDTIDHLQDRWQVQQHLESIKNKDRKIAS